jgi:2-polyprenyl-3-methyl-5-hydroxy-6-metoxy-1,4-benzoquinol methylase
MSLYADSQLESSAPCLGAMLNLLEQHARSGGRVLDIGCGAGHFIRPIKSDYVTMGIELAPSRYRISKERGVDVVSEPLNAPFWDDYRGAFNAITLWDVIEHLNWPLAMCIRIRELLSPGGVLLIDTPNASGILYRFGDLACRMTRGRKPFTLGIQYRPTPFNHKQIFHKVDMVRMLDQTGFDVVSIVEKTELSLPVDFYIRQLAPYAVRWLTPIAKATLRHLPLNNKLVVVARR